MILVHELAATSGRFIKDGGRQERIHNSTAEVEAPTLAKSDTALAPDTLVTTVRFKRTRPPQQDVGRTLRLWLRLLICKVVPSSYTVGAHFIVKSRASHGPFACQWQLRLGGAAAHVGRRQLDES